MPTVVTRPAKAMRLRAFKGNSSGLQKLLLSKGLVAKRVWVAPGTGPTGRYHTGYWRLTRQAEEEAEAQEVKHRPPEGPLLQYPSRGYFAEVYMDEEDWDKWFANADGVEASARMNAALALANYGVPPDQAKRGDDVSSLGKEISPDLKPLVEDSIADIISSVHSVDDWNSLPQRDREKIIDRMIGKRAKSIAANLSIDDERTSLSALRMIMWHIEQGILERAADDDTIKDVLSVRSHPFVEDIPDTAKGHPVEPFHTVKLVASGDALVPVIYDPKTKLPKLDKDSFGRVSSTGERYITEQEWNNLIAEVMASRHVVFDKDGNPVFNAIPFEGEVPDTEWGRDYWRRGGMDVIHHAVGKYMRRPYRLPPESMERIISAGITGAIEALLRYNPKLGRDPDIMLRSEIEPHSAMALLSNVATWVNRHCDLEADRLVGEKHGNWTLAAMELDRRYKTRYKEFRILAHAINKAREAEFMATGVWNDIPSPESIVEAASDERYKIEKYLRNKGALEKYKQGDKEPWENYIRKMYNQQVIIDYKKETALQQGSTPGSAPAVTPSEGLPEGVFRDAYVLGILESGGVPEYSGTPGAADIEIVRRGWRGSRTAQDERIKSYPAGTTVASGEVQNRPGEFNPREAYWTGDPKDEYRYIRTSQGVVGPQHLASLDMAAKAREGLMERLSQIRHKTVRERGSHELKEGSNLIAETPGAVEIIDKYFFPMLPIDSSVEYGVDTAERDRLLKIIAINEREIDETPKTFEQYVQKYRERGGAIDTSDPKAMRVARTNWVKQQNRIAPILEQRKEAIKRAMRKLKDPATFPKVVYPPVMSLSSATPGMTDVALPRNRKGEVRSDLIRNLERESDPVGEVRRRLNTEQGRIAWHMALKEALSQPQYNSVKALGISSEDLSENGQLASSGPLGPIIPHDLRNKALMSLQEELGVGPKTARALYHAHIEEARRGGTTVAEAERAVTRKILKERYGTEVSPTRYADRTASDRGITADLGVHKVKYSRGIRRLREATGKSPSAPQSITPSSSPTGPARRVRSVTDRVRAVIESDTRYGEPVVFNNEKSAHGSGRDRLRPYDSVYSLVTRDAFDKWYKTTSQVIEYVGLRGFLKPDSPNAIRAVKELEMLSKGYTPTKGAADDPFHPSNWIAPEGSEGSEYGIPRLAPVPRAKTSERKEWSKKQDREFALRERKEAWAEKRRRAGKELERIVSTAEAKERAASVVRAGIRRSKGQSDVSRAVQSKTETAVSLAAKIKPRIADFAARQKQILLKEYAENPEKPTAKELGAVERELDSRVSAERARLISELRQGIKEPSVPEHDPLLRSRSAANLIGLWNAAMETEAGSTEAVKQSSGSSEWRSIWKLIPAGAYVPPGTTTKTLGKKPRRNVRIRALLPKTRVSGTGKRYTDEKGKEREITVVNPDVPPDRAVMPPPSKRTVTKPEMSPLAKSVVSAFLRSPLSLKVGLSYTVNVPRNESGAVVRTIGREEDKED